MHLGLDAQSGAVYEGMWGPTRPVVPLPSICLATLVEGQDDGTTLPAGLHQSAATAWAFRDDGFDPLTRLRRGRLYAPSGASQPSAQRVIAHPYEDPFPATARLDGHVPKSLFTFIACTQLHSHRNQGLGLKLALGTDRAASRWRIVQTEVLVDGCVLVVLKALTTYGVLPELNLDALPGPYRADITQAMDKVTDSAYRESPVAVIDQCRNAMTVLISRWLVQQGAASKHLSDDLAKLANAIERAPHDKSCVSWAAQLVARLHVRGKDNERLSKGLRSLYEQDAALAIEALGFAVRDMGWGTG